MPRFSEKPSHFEVRVDHEGEEVVLKVRWTPQADDELVCLYKDRGDGRLGPDEDAVYALMLRQAVEWEGVLDEEGNPIPYSSEKLSALFPPGLKLRLIQRFIVAAWTYAQESAANPT